MFTNHSLLSAAHRDATRERQLPGWLLATLLLLLCGLPGGEAVGQSFGYRRAEIWHGSQLAVAPEPPLGSSRPQANPGESPGIRATAGPVERVAATEATHPLRHPLRNYGQPAVVAEQPASTLRPLPPVPRRSASVAEAIHHVSGVPTAQDAIYPVAAASISRPALAVNGPTSALTAPVEVAHASDASTAERLAESRSWGRVLLPLTFFLSGLLICPLVVGLALVVAARRLSKGGQPFFKVEIVNSPSPDAHLVMRSNHAAAGDEPDSLSEHESSRFPEPARDDLAGIVVDLADEEISLMPSVMTYADQQRQEQERSLEREQSIFDQVIEENEGLQQQLDLLRQAE